MRILIVVLLAAACASAAQPRVDRADQLPGHRYRVPRDVGRLVIDPAAFAELARPLRTDLEHDFASFDIREPATLKDHLFILALLDALDGRWTEALARIDRIAAVETKPVEKMMTGLTIRLWVDARAHGGGPDAFRAALERKLATMPIDLVRGELSILRTLGQVFTPDVCRGLVDDKIGPQVENGTISLDQAEAITFQRYAVLHLVPVGSVIDQVLGEHGIEARQ